MKAENIRRAGKAAMVLEAYDIESEGCLTALTDLLSDVMHLAKVERVDFYQALATAKMHYNEESSGENNI